MPPYVSAMLENMVDFPVACAVDSSMLAPILISPIMSSCSSVYGSTNILCLEMKSLLERNQSCVCLVIYCGRFGCCLFEFV